MLLTQPPIPTHFSFFEDKSTPIASAKDFGIAVTSAPESSMAIVSIAKSPLIVIGITGVLISSEIGLSSINFITVS